ncbi:MAG: phosphoglycerate kinase [Parachlamydiaceae bacterium]|nr:phosphoglycerate kinase [Parachlamydiaceae bacterium]
MQKLSLEDLDIQGKKILMRVDFNVPLDAQGNITDDSRIVATLPSIRYVLQEGGSLILMSHLGRPKSKKEHHLSLTACAKRLEEFLHLPVTMAPDCIGQDVEELVNKLKPNQIILLENLRFHPGEEAPKEHPEFVEALAKLGDIYVNDAFGTAHRFHASTAAIAKFFPENAAAGYLLKKEIQFLGETLKNPLRPFYAVIGGAKISTKMGALTALLGKVDVLLIGGAMAYTFFKAQGIDIGDSLYEEDQIDKARFLLGESHKRGISLLLPCDTLITESIEKGAPTKVVNIHEGIPKGWKGVDIGPKTLELFTQEIQKAKTVLWNGPLGVFEIKDFATGTLEFAKAMAYLDAIKIVGGGDSLAAVQAADVAEQMTHLSTGGGATLEYIEFGTLPGIDALSLKK